ncbi:MAG TPA: ROK family protein [Gemmatimonadaceae bacterium]|jgi:predicted NBD/HSP70 family sugar kinase
MKTLVIDVGGTNVKLLATGKRTPIKIESGTEMTPQRMVEQTKEATAHWDYDRISIGFPGPVRNDQPLHEPWNLGKGWVGFNFKRAFGKPVRLINDAAMQALGSYSGGRMLFLGLGTGLGSTMIYEGTLIPLELAHLPYEHGESYEAWVGNAGYDDLGKRRWRKHVLDIVDLFMAALQVDYVVLGGGNARHMKDLPKYVRLGSNAHAFKGGFRMWDD